MIASTGHLIFVYGSLKRGYALHGLLRDQEFVGSASTTADYRMFDTGDYPALIEAPSGNSISGEVYRVDHECLLRLDAAECVAERLYERRRVQLASPYGDDLVEAWFWLREYHDLQEIRNWP